MARRIKETPVLTGKDALDFEQALERNRDKKVSAAEFQRGKDAFARVRFVERKTG